MGEQRSHPGPARPRRRRSVRFPFRRPGTRRRRLRGRDRHASENSFVESSNYNFGSSWVSSRGFLGVSFGRYESTYGVPIDPDEPDEEVFIDQEQDRVDVAGRLEQPFTGLRSIDIRAGYNDYTHTEFEGPGEPGTVFDNEAWEGRITFNHEAIGPFLGSLGIQVIDRDFSAVGEEAFVPPAEESAIGVFVFEDTDWNDWHFEAGARFDHQSIEPRSGGDIEHDTYSISAGALWNFTPGYAIGLNAGRAQRAPALEELLASGPHLATGTFEIGDTGLDEETSNNIDLSLRKTDGRLSWRANVFVNYIEDFIFLDEQDLDGDGVADEVDDEGNPGGELLLVNYTQANALFYGLEAEALYNLFDDHRGLLEARLFGDWVRGRLDGGDDLPRITPPRLGLGFDYHRGPFQGDIELTYVFEQNDTAALETDTDGYAMLDIGASYTLARAPAQTRLFLRGTNLLNEDARRHTSFLKDRAPLPGRSAIAGIRVSF
ncbi:MAG: TonB-dependent receptor [Gammaproteobacteria bacterium]|nr:TonB-dependent receptor [Gammaproteobacteria bacterium]